jgi:hypothetical protein
MAGKPRSGKGKSTRSRNPRPQTAPAVNSTASAPVSAAPDAAVSSSMLPRRRGMPVITDLNEATAARYPYVVRELKQVGILAAIVIVLLIILFFTLS